MDFDKLNSMTKYPEIKTYHKIAGKGILQEELTTELNPDQLYHVSEKVDGNNTRQIFIIEDYYSDYLIGSREELLTSKDDRIYNPALDVVENLLEQTKSIADKMFCFCNDFKPGIYTIYQELYGGKLPATKQYTTSKEYASRVFDINYLSPEEFEKLMELPRDKISLWRQNGGQHFLNTDDRIAMCKFLNLSTVPFRENIYGLEVPARIQETYQFLTSYKITKAGINYEGGRAEGVVIRSDDRKQIVKLRFEDYERTLGIKRK